MGLDDDISRWEVIKKLEYRLYRRAIREDLAEYIKILISVKALATATMLINTHPWLQEAKQNKKIPKAVGINKAIEVFRAEDAYRKALFGLHYHEAEELKNLRSTFVMRHHKLIYHCARRSFPFLSDEEQEDAANISVLGLLRALDKWSPKKGAYTTYAYKWVFQSIIRQTVNENHMVRLPAHAWSSGMRPTTPISLDEPYKPESETTRYNFYATIEATQDEDYLRQEARLTAVEYIVKLKPIHKYIIRKRFGIDCKESCTLKEIGATLGITRERVRQLESVAINALRAYNNKNCDAICNNNGLILKKCTDEFKSLPRSPRCCAQIVQLELYNCIYYNACLYEAAKQRWKGMTCKDCPIFKSEVEKDMKLFGISIQGREHLDEAVKNSTVAATDFYKHLQATGDVEALQLNIMEVSAELRHLRRQIAKNKSIDIYKYMEDRIAQRKASTASAKRKHAEKTRNKKSKQMKKQEERVKDQNIKKAKGAEKEVVKRKLETQDEQELSSTPATHEELGGSFVVKPDGSIVAPTLRAAIELSKLLRT